MNCITHRSRCCLLAGVIALLALVSNLSAQYIGFVYPAGGQQGTTFQVKMGGQGFQEINGAYVSGTGVKARIVEYNKHMNPQEVQLLGEQLRELKFEPPEKPDLAITNMIERIQKLTREHVLQTACASIANIVIVEVTIEPNATPGLREIRVTTPRGVSNPLVFNVGQVPEVSGEPMVTCPLVTLGKEEQSLRRKKRDTSKQGGAEMMMMDSPMMMGSAGAASDLDDEEVCVNIPCIMNGQIAQGTVDRYRFAAKKGQKLVISVQARELIPFLADAVPGWFQPVLVLCDAKGKELAYADDYYFKPDPVILFEVPADGDYLLAIYDAIYRGREDWVYRINIGETPFITSIFPMGARVGDTTKIEVKGWNLEETSLTPDMKNKEPGIYPITVRGKGGLVSNPMPFSLDSIPDCQEKEPNSQMKTAQKVTLPVMVNGHIDKTSRKDLFQFEGKAGDDVVAEVFARRLNSPLDPVVKLTDASGKILALNDDREDVAAGINTHHADPYIRAKLPANGTYYVHLDDTQHKGGDEYGYRLRISAPQPDFELRLVPSMVAIRSNSTASLKAFAIRQDGFTNTINFALKGDTNDFVVTGRMTGTQATTQVTVKTKLIETKEPVTLVIEGSATNKTQKIVHLAVPSEDRMQAFLWRHLVPAQELKALVFNPPPPPPKVEVKKEPPKTNEVKKVEFPTGLMMQLNFDQWEGGGNVTDRTGRGNNGRAFGGAKWIPVGKMAGGYEFNATNNYIRVTNSLTLNSKTATYALWLRTAKSLDVDRYIFEKQKDNGFALCIAGGSKNPADKGKLRFVVNNNECLSDGTVADGAWHHAIAVYDGEKLKLYVDGEPQKQVTSWKGEIGSNTNILAIGMNCSNPTPQEKNTGFDGVMDDIMIFNQSINDEEAKAVLASTKPKFTKNQVARRIIELKELFDRGLLVQSFYERKVKECEVAE